MRNAIALLLALAIGGFSGCDCGTEQVPPGGDETDAMVGIALDGGGTLIIYDDGGMVIEYDDGAIVPYDGSIPGQDAGGVNLDGGGTVVTYDDGGTVIVYDDGAIVPYDGSIPGQDGGSIGTDAAGSDIPGWVPDDAGVIVVQDGGVIITEDGGYVHVCYELNCYGQNTSCGDCEDNDGDGFVDWRDPECLGPCDNTEGPGLESGVGGTTGTSCGVDCYFDWGNGPGNDQCKWDHRCDPLSPEEPTCTYDAEWTAGHSGQRECPETQVQQCYDFCMPLTPNGCDCFGCCTFPDLYGINPDGSDGYVWIGNMDEDNNSTCTLADVTDNDLCPPCTPVGNCLNECGPCEVCVGRPVPPPECFPNQQDAGYTQGPDAFFPDGTVFYPDGAAVLPDGAIVQVPDAAHCSEEYPELCPGYDAGVIIPDGSVAFPDGATLLPDGAIVPTPDSSMPDSLLPDISGTDTSGVDTLRPDAAQPDTSPTQCPPQVIPCGLPGQDDCPQGMYCLTGCCVLSG